MKNKHVNVIGAGILGLWQALTLLRRGAKVRLFDNSETPFQHASSRFAGAMLAPFCEAEPSQPELQRLGIKSLDLWNASEIDVATRGTLVVAAPRDRQELDIFAKRTNGHRIIDGDEVGQLEAEFRGRFQRALYFEREAHLSPRPVLAQLLELIGKAGGEIVFGFDGREGDFDHSIDCRGIGASSDIEGLRPVRGEMAVVKLPGVQLTRPVRLLHPRMPCYIVPWPDCQYMIGATVIESGDDGPVSVRSALELLGAAFSVHPDFGGAKIVELSVGLRPAFADNMPKIQVDGSRIFVNGAYRHGFLLAPLLAEFVADYLETGVVRAELFR